MFDITDIYAIHSLVADNQVNAIVNCTAYINVDVTERNETLVEKPNVTAPENYAIAMKEVDGFFV